MKTYETRFVNSVAAAEALGIEGFEVKSSHTNPVGQPVIIMQREMPAHHEPEEWPPIDNVGVITDQLARSLTNKALEKAAMQ